MKIPSQIWSKKVNAITRTRAINARVKLPWFLCPNYGLPKQKSPSQNLSQPRSTLVKVSVLEFQLLEILVSSYIGLLKFQSNLVNVAARKDNVPFALVERERPKNPYLIKMRERER